MGMNRMEKLAAYHQWAQLRTLEHLKKVPESVFCSKLDNVFPSISHTLSHMFEADQLWLTRIRGISPASISDGAFDSLQAAEEYYVPLLNEMRLTIQGLDETESISYVTMKGQPFEDYALDLVSHIVSHGSYHRGNITSMLRQQGYPGPSVDYLYFIRELKES